MALSRSEIVAKSDAKRGYKNKALKLPLETIALIEQLAQEQGITQGQLIVEAVKQYQESSAKAFR